jgi:ribosome-associated protein
MLIINDRIRIPLSEIEIQFTRSSGPGGQNVNKTNTKVNIAWNLWTCFHMSAAARERFALLFPSKITSEGLVRITSDRFRDQSRNTEDCLEKLRAMILSACIPPKTRHATKPTRASQRRRLDEKTKQKKKKEDRRNPKWD